MSKVHDVSGGMFVIHVEYKYLSEALETFYHHQFYKRWNKMISVNEMIMMPQSVNNIYMHGSCYISLFNFKSFDQFNPFEQPQILDI